MGTPDTAFLLAACDAFRRCGDAAEGADQRKHWYGLADRAWRALEAEEAHDGAVRVPVNQAGRTIGQHHHRARLSDADVDLIHELRDAGLSLAQIAAKFECSRSTVFGICNGATRSYSVAGHRLQRASRAPIIRPASIDEFEVCG